MPRFLMDEDFDNDILRGLRRHHPTLDIVRVQEVGLRTQPDAQVMEWAALEGRLLLTHDVTTMPQEGHARVKANLPMPGIVLVNRAISIGQAIEEIALLDEASREGEWEGQVVSCPCALPAVPYLA